MTKVIKGAKAGIKWRNDGTGLGDADYLPDGVVMHDGVYRLPIKGAKAGMPEQHTPTIAKDSVASKSKIKILYGLSEGEVKGLANGAASIMLDGTPLLDSDGNANFEGVTWEVRNGTVDQPHIEGLPNVSNENNIGTILRFGTPWIYNLTDTQLSSVNVNVSWSRLSEMTDKMDVVGTRVDYTIEVQTDGYGYQTVLTAFVQDKTSGRYQRTHNIKLPKAKNGWQIRVKKLTADGDNEKIFNQMSVDSIAEIIDVKLRYPCTALLYLSYDAKTFGNVPKLSVDFMGRYVQVPSNYDPVTRTSAGLWDGTFKQAYTDNPAWHYYDLITNDRYGLGQRLKPFMISKWALQRIAAICDIMVDDGKGGTEPRYTCNLYLQTAEDAFSVLQHLAGIFRGLSFWDGSQITIEADTYRDTDYTITRANVVNGEFIKTGSSWSNRHTVAKVAWSNPANAYETEYVMVRSEQAIAKFGINILDLPAVGCISEGQAYRMGLSALLTEQRRNQTVSFAMGLDGALPSVGDRIDIADPMFAGHNNGGRIASVSSDFKTITLDRDVTAKIGDTITVNLDAGKAQSRKITGVAGRAITVDTGFDAVSAQNVWSIASDTLPTMPFTVMSVTANDDGTQYNYTALQYDATLYDSIDKGVIIEAPSVNSVSINPRQINAPATVTIAPRYRVEQGQSITTLVITWDQVKEAAEYEVEWRRDNDSWKVLGRTTNISAEVDGVYAGQYQARVKAISAFEISSNTTYSDTVTIAAKLTNPSGVLTLKAYGLLFGMRIDWTFPTNSSDTAYTEIEVAKAPSVNVSTLGTFSYPTNTAVMQGLEGNLTLYFRARLVDKLGFKSNWSDWVYGTTDANAQKVLDLLNGQITESQLYQDLSAKIGKISTIESGLSQEIQDRVNAQAQEASNRQAAIDAEIQNRTAAIKVNSDAITAERDARIADIKTNADAINQETQNRITAIKSVSDGLTQEIKDRQSGDSKTLEVITTYKTSNDNALAAVQSDIKTVTTAQSATASKLDGVYAIVTPLTADSNSWTADSGTKQATAWTLQSAIVDGDSALSQRIDSLTASVNSNSAAIISEQTARADADKAITQRVDNYIAQTDSSIATVKQDVKTQADKTSANSNAITALDNRVTTIDTNTNTAMQNAASAVSKAETAVNQAGSASSLAQTASATATNAQSVANTAKSTAETANTNAATAVSKATAAADSASATAATLQQVKVDLAGKASAGAVTAIDGKVTELGGKVTANTTKLDGVYAIVTPLTADSVLWTADSGTKTATAWTLQSAYATADMALSQKIDNVSATYNDSLASVQRETKAVSDKYSALATDVNIIKAAQSGNLALVMDNYYTKATTDQTIAQKISTFKSEVVDPALKQKADAGALQEMTAKADRIDGQLQAASTKLDGVYARVVPLTADSNSWTADSGTKQATAWTLQSAIVEGDSALSQRIDSLTAATDSNIATIRSEQTAQSTKLTATATKTDTLQTTVEGNTSLIQIQQQSINGLYGQYFVKLDVNGRVSGFGTANDGTVSDFAVRADKFYIAPPDGTDKGDAPFIVTTTPQVIDGVTIPAGTYIKAAYIAKASIDTLHIKGNAVTVPVSAFTGDTISVGSSYTTIQSLYVPAGMGHTMLTFNAVFNFGGFDSAQQLLCRIVKGDQVIVNDLEVFYNESDAQEIVTGHAGSHSHGVSTSFSGSTSNTGSHTHGGSVSLNGSTGSAFVGNSSHSHSIGGNSSFNTSSSGDHSHSVSGSVSVSVQSDAGHSHTIRSTNKSRNAGTIAVSRHDSSEVDGVYYLQIKVARGSAVNLSNRYIHAITMRR
ncbi:TipJ family phage tail tip protein [Moraxella osloensis]|uniref:TipJ family phage tail tip protein n=1 Tax=Faucicola osloensis TaxID=34062 RepID=UPI00200357AB|nr:phage tail protein [Moraxella osloensis]MCK6052522.1 phage tail protein [Moraxella osloensis]